MRIRTDTALLQVGAASRAAQKPPTLFVLPDARLGSAGRRSNLRTHHFAGNGAILARPFPIYAFKLRGIGHETSASVIHLLLPSDAHNGLVNDSRDVWSRPVAGT